MERDRLEERSGIGHDLDVRCEELHRRVETANVVGLDCAESVRDVRLRHHYPLDAASRSAAARASVASDEGAVTRATKPSTQVNTKGLRRVSVLPGLLPTGRPVSRVTTNTTPLPRSRISSGSISCSSYTPSQSSRKARIAATPSKVVPR